MSNLSKPIIVEFYGLPGVGKTSICDEVNQILSQKNIEIKRPISVKGKLLRYVSKLFLILRILLTNPYMFFSIAINIYKTKQITLIDFIKNFINSIILVNAFKKHSKSNGVMISDQGIFQALWSLSLSSKNNNIFPMLRSLEKSLKVSILIVIVEADISIIKKRLKVRPGKNSRIESRKESNFSLINAIKVHEELNKNVNRDLFKLDYSKITVFNNAQNDLKLNATIIVNSIEEKLEYLN